MQKMVLEYSITDNNPVKQSHHIKYLGVLIDENLNWKEQIKEQCSKVARGSWALNQLKQMSKHYDLFTTASYTLIYNIAYVVGGLLQNQH